MSTAKRVISGSVASWMRIGITMLAQLLLVPVYLTYWKVEVYGIWIAIQALITVISTLDQGHQTFLEFEFLKNGKSNRNDIAVNLWSSVWISLGIGLLEIAIVAYCILSGLIGKMLGAASVMDVALVRDAGRVLLMQIISWVLLTNMTGIFLRALSPFGYYPRMSWWGVLATLITSVLPVVAVMLGADLLQAGWVLVLATALYAVPQYVDIFRLMKREGIIKAKSSFKRGANNFFLSIALSGKCLLENARQQGVRVILAPLSGAVGLVAFSTMRTGANIALQGLNTITNPLMPELMRFLNAKDQQRMEASFGTVWIVVVLLLSPGVVLLQAFIGPLFVIWTKGQVNFDPLLFTLLSLGVLVYAVAQPAMAIIKGNNLLRPQLVIAIVAAIVVVGGMFILVPAYGIVGAGFSLLAAEIIAAVYYRIVAGKWLRMNSISWPAESYRFALASVWVAAATMFAMIFFPNLKWLLVTAGLAFLIVVFVFYWKSLPAIVLHKVENILSRIPVIRKAYKAR